MIYILGSLGRGGYNRGANIPDPPYDEWDDYEEESDNDEDDDEEEFE